MGYFITTLGCLSLVYHFIPFPPKEATAQASIVYDMNCIEVSDLGIRGGIKRCENQETVCYIGNHRNDPTISCKFK